jgi:exodeoxyribonuclease-3
MTEDLVPSAESAATESPESPVEETSAKREPPMEILKIITFNVASLRAAWGHGLEDYVHRTKPDILLIQETKMSASAKPSIDDMVLRGYHGYFLHAKKKGYSGTAVFTKITPLSIVKTPGISDENGRCITVEFSKFYLVNTYVVNAGQNLQFKDTKMNIFLPELRSHLESLRTKKPVIWSGDLNVAHQDIDIWMPKGHEGVAGFTPEERAWFGEFLASGWKDVFRELYPNKQQFSFFSYFSGDRMKNHGWRIDYFIVTDDLMREEGLIYDCVIDGGAGFSDHCPVSLLLDRTMILDENDLEVNNSCNEEIGVKHVKSVLDFFGAPTKND